MLEHEIGKLRHRVTIQSKVETPDGYGGFTAVWSDVTTVAARIEDVKGPERFEAMQLEAPVTHKITIRYRSGIDATNRIKFGTRYFDIQQVLNPEQRNRWLELMVLEGVISQETEA